MSGTSEFEIGGKKYEITFAFNGSDLLRDGFTLAETNIHDLETPAMDVNQLLDKYENFDYSEEPTARQELIDLGAENLVDMILGWVKNGGEL